MLIPKITISSFRLVLPVVFLIGCTDPGKKDEAAMKMLKESLANSNEVIASQTEMLYQALDNRKTDGSYRSVEKWQQKALAIKAQTAVINKYLDSLSSLLNERKISLNKEISRNLYEKLHSYEKALLGIDTVINVSFKDWIIKKLLPEKFGASTEVGFYSSYFLGESIPGALGILSSFKNSTTRIENNMIQFCLNRTHMIIEDFTEFSSLMAISSSIVEQGQEIEITAGVGEFSAAGNPHITIKSKNIPLNGAGVAIYKFKATGAPGKYSIPVEIKYTTRSGEEKTELKEIEYRIKN